MPILTLQRRVHELGRIRLGARSPGGRPGRALETFRFSSQRRDLLEVLSQAHGGSVMAWDEQWELVSNTDALAVLIPPEDVGFSQWREHWTADGCQRRCDGVMEVLHDVPCMCDADGQRICNDTTRLNVLLPDLESFGTWRVETHSYYAAMELRSAVELALGLAHRRGAHLAVGTLRIERRVVKRVGEPPKRFSVPVLDVAMTPALPDHQTRPEAQAGPQALAIAAARDDTDVPHVARIARGDETAPVITLPASDAKPPTLLAPREAEGVTGDDERKQQKRMFARVGELLPDTEPAQRDELRHALAVLATTTSRATTGRPPAASWNDCTPPELTRIEGMLQDLKRGNMFATPRTDGGYIFTSLTGKEVHVYQVDGAWTYNAIH